MRRLRTCFESASVHGTDLLDHYAKFGGTLRAARNEKFDVYWQHARSV